MTYRDSFFILGSNLYPMRTTQLMLSGLLCIVFVAAQAQTTSDTTNAKEKALNFADSLIRSAYYEDWQTYLNLSNPSAIKYYGGKERFKEQAVTHHFRSLSEIKEEMPKTKLVELMNDLETWQCVVEKTRQTYIENRKAFVHTYLVGSSTDNGNTWKFIDVSQNKLENVIYLMPDIFGDLAIPEGLTEYEDEILAQQEAEEAQAANKKPERTVKRRGK